MTGAWQTVAVAGWLVAAAAAAALVALRRRWAAELERFRAVSERDALCGVYNKGALVSLVSDLFGRRGARLRGTLLLVDIDRFKDVNDEFGHAEGDEILRAVGEALRGGFRAGDIVGRFGGDEFMVFAEGLVDPATIGEKVAALREAAREAGFAHVGRPVTCSVGALVIDGRTVTYDAALRQADAALYEAKRSGRDRHVTRSFEEPVCPAAGERRAGAGGGRSDV